MNIHIYRQADSRWASLPYPGRGYNFGPNACGACAVLHCIIEMDKYKNWTPANVQPYMKQYATYGSGTTWAGIQKALVYYGLKDVANIPTMPQLWRELQKGNRVGVLLFGSTKGPDGTVWTTGGHYIAFVDYKYENGQHWLYLKDSGGRKHDRWWSYEKSMKGDVRQVWIGRLPNGHEIDGKPTDVDPAPSTDGKLTIDGVGGVATIKALQKYLKMSVQDGKLSGQNKSLNKYYPSITSVSYGLGGSATVKALQKWVGVSADGIWGQATSKALQKKLGVTADGIFGAKSVKALQKFLNNNNGGGGTSTTKTSSTTTAPSQTPAPSTPANFRENIIDVSYVQSKTIDWNKVKADGVHGAIIRCGYRGYGSGALNEDSMFMNHITGANKAGLKLGIYFFTEAINAAEGKAEAQFTLKMLKKAGVKLTYPIAIDTENINAKNPVPRANSTKLSAAKRTEAIKAFCEEIKANGYEPMIYASTDWLNNQLQMSKLPYTIWVTQYNDRVTYKGKYAIWQYTSTAKVNGINQVVDKNYCYVNYSTPTASVTQTVTPVVTPMAPAPSTSLKSIDIVAQEVLDGKWGSGDARKQKLQAAGYNYDAVQAKVNEILKIQNAPGQISTINRVVLEIFDGKWGSGDARKQKLVAAGYDYDAIQKRVTEVAAHMKSRKEAMKPWFDACKAQRDWSYNAKYSWNKWDKTIAGSKNYGTCITFPSVVAMRCGLIKEKYKIASTGGKNDSKATQDSFYNASVKAMNSINGKYWSSIKYPNKTTAQLVKEGKIKEGDTLGFMGHTASYAYKDSNGNLLFNHAGHAAGIYDNNTPGSNRAVLNVKSPGMSKRLVYGVFSVNTFIVITSCTNGTITYSDRYMAGQNVTISIKPNAGYTLKSLKIDGKTVGLTNTYTINKIDSHHVIEAICESGSTPKKSIDEIAQEVLEGKWGSGTARKTALINAGYDYDKVQAKVNELLKPKETTPAPSEPIVKPDYTKEEEMANTIIAQFTKDSIVKIIELLQAHINKPEPTPEPMPEPTPQPTPQSVVAQKYTGTLPTIALKKTNAQVISDAIVWAKWIAGDNSFHYGYGDHSHHNGCYFCGTQPKSKKNAGIVGYEKSYCCNPFVGAAWAHGGGDSKAWQLCHKGSSWDFGANSGYAKSSLFKNLGHPAKSTLKAGDVLCNNHHVALYIGNEYIAEAGGSDDNKRNSTKWNNSIRITKLTDSRYKDFLRVHRYIGSVDTTRPIYYGDVSYRVKDLQRYLNWYFGKEVCTVDGVFGDGTLKYVKAFQVARKLTADGIVGSGTIAEMGKVTK